MKEAEGTLIMPGKPGERVGFFLIHGLGGSPVEMRFLAQSLNRAGHPVTCPMLAGHGGTPAEFDASRWTEWYISAEASLERMRRACDTIIVGGISAGAVIALRLAAERKDLVAGCALYAPTFWPNGWTIPKSLHLFKLVRQKWFANLFRFSEQAPYGIKDDRIRKMVLDSLTAGNKPMDEVFGRRGGTLLEFRWLAKDTTKRLGKVSQPTFVVHPREDDQSDLSNSIMLMRRLGGRVEALVLDDSYHMVVLDRQRQMVVDRSLGFAKSLAADIAAIEDKQRWRALGQADESSGPQPSAAQGG
jgi:carboxylesterase